MIIDTARNGNDEARSSDCKAWCNLRSAFLGDPPTASTALPDVVDAYFWIKTPGESDGCTASLPEGTTCPRFDADCAKITSIGSRLDEPRAPEAGVFFTYQALQLAQGVRYARLFLQMPRASFWFLPRALSSRGFECPRHAHAMALHPVCSHTLRSRIMPEFKHCDYLPLCIWLHLIGGGFLGLGSFISHYSAWNHPYTWHRSFSDQHLWATFSSTASRI